MCRTFLQHFQVRACDSAIITMSQWQGVPSFSTYQIYLDGWQGSQSAIVVRDEAKSTYTDGNVR